MRAHRGQCKMVVENEGGQKRTEPKSGREKGASPSCHAELRFRFLVRPFVSKRTGAGGMQGNGVEVAARFHLSASALMQPWCPKDPSLHHCFMASCSWRLPNTLVAWRWKLVARYVEYTSSEHIWRSSTERTWGLVPVNVRMLKWRLASSFK